jgi:hypothetical protein
MAQGGGKMTDIDILADLAWSLKCAKDSDNWPLALPNVLDIERQLRKSIASIGKFRKSKHYKTALKTSIKVLELRIKLGNEQSHEELKKSGDLDWHLTNKRYLRLLKAEL